MGGRGGDRSIALNSLGPPGYPEILDIWKTWMSGKPGCLEDLGVRNLDFHPKLDLRHLVVCVLVARCVDKKRRLVVPPKGRQPADKKGTESHWQPLLPIATILAQKHLLHTVQ